MKKAHGTVTLALPFAAGVCLAALAAKPLPTALAGSVAAAAALAASLAGCRRTVPLTVLLFAALGAVCWSSEALSPSPPPPRIFDGLAEGLAEAIGRAGLPGEHSGAIVTALLTGRRGALPRETTAIFRSSGAAHLLALSGLHLGVIYLILSRLLSPLGNSRAARALRSAVTVGLCGIYTLATGAGPSIVRAFLFISTGECAKLLRMRRIKPAGTLSLALTVQLALRPGLISSAGFQMSYLAMLGIVALYPRLEAWYPPGSRHDPMRRIWKAAALSVSCQLFTAPVAWWHFRTFPRYFLMANLLGLPLTEAVIVTAVATLLLQAAGICPGALPRLCGTLVQALEFCLHAISTM